ncbi:MAG TPA: DNA-binding protein WhiA [Clostridiales bacterium]|nr:DNA-binding protein WhiA [Clostridiales bacterium]
MSYASEVKKEIVGQESEGCCKFAQLYAMMLFGHCFSLKEIGILTKHKAVAEEYSRLLFEVFGVSVPIITTKGGRYSVYLENKRTCTGIYNCCGYSRPIATTINFENLENDCCKIAFIKGAFLTSGTITNPEKSYHFEISSVCDSIAKGLLSVFRECSDIYNKENFIDHEIYAKLGNRKGIPFLYIKDSQSIETMLALLGADIAAIQLIRTKIGKDIKNNVIRKTNLDIANIGRTADASGKYTEAIKRKLADGSFKNLSPSLQELAMLKYENPEMTLNDLAKKFNLTRSAVNYRLNKLLK